MIVDMACQKFFKLIDAVTYANRTPGVSIFAKEMGIGSRIFIAAKKVDIIVSQCVNFFI